MKALITILFLVLASAIIIDLSKAEVVSPHTPQQKWTMHQNTPGNFVGSTFVFPSHVSSTPTPSVEIIGTLPLQVSSPDLQPSDQVQPQQATGGVSSY